MAGSRDFETAASDYHEAKKRAQEDFELRYLATRLQQAGGNITHAAELSGLARPTFSNLAKKHGLDPAEFREQAGRASREDR